MERSAFCYNGFQNIVISGVIFVDYIQIELTADYLSIKSLTTLKIDISYSSSVAKGGGKEEVLQPPHWMQNMENTTF